MGLDQQDREECLDRLMQLDKASLEAMMVLISKLASADNCASRGQVISVKREPFADLSDHSVQ